MSTVGCPGCWHQADRPEYQLSSCGTVDDRAPQFCHVLSTEHPPGNPEWKRTRPMKRHSYTFQMRLSVIQIPHFLSFVFCSAWCLTQPRRGTNRWLVATEGRTLRSQERCQQPDEPITRDQASTYGQGSVPLLVGNGRPKSPRSLSRNIIVLLWSESVQCWRKECCFWLNLQLEYDTRCWRTKQAVNREDVRGWQLEFYPEMMQWLS